MLEWIEKTTRILAGHVKLYPGQTQLHILKGQLLMALDVSKLTAALSANSAATSRNTAAVDALLASHSDPAGQTVVDAAAVALSSNNDVLNAESAKAEAAVAPPAPTSAPA